MCIVTKIGNGADWAAVERGGYKGQNGGENGEGRGANARNKSLPRDRGRDLKLVDRAAEGALRLADLSIDHIG